MVEFTVTILGCGSAKPSLRHHTSSQIVTRLGKLYMIDCGEGTQMQLMKYGFHPGQLGNIFISHAHGDHCLGLVGLLSSLSLDKRTTDINLHVPSDFVDILKAQIDFFVTHTEFDIRIHPIECQEPTLIFSDQHFDVTAFPLEHRVPCYGFLFREKAGSRHIIPECIQQYGISRTEIERIRGGGDFTAADGQIIPNEKLTTPPDPVRSYAYLSDTRPVMQYADLLRGVDLLYHDATYCEGDEELACKYDHSTASQAAEFAKVCGAGKLLLGHFSSRYGGEDWLLERALGHFPRIVLANEGLTVKITDKTDTGPVFVEWRR
jgi:ribonuclease Z